MVRRDVCLDVVDVAAADRCVAVAQLDDAASFGQSEAAPPGAVARVAFGGCVAIHSASMA
jgi:hypothetical protein